MQTHSQQAEEIARQAEKIASEPERIAFLQKQCGNDVLLREHIQRLLEDMKLLKKQLEGSSCETNDAPDIQQAPVTERVPVAPRGQEVVGLPFTSGLEQIGPYRLLTKLGEGGMGVVYLAEQTQPVRRQVALKIIKPGKDSDQVIARFEAERQALALMDHPNIARVLDGGATSTGRPFFVMELVKGIPLTRYCDQEHLTLRERLELFIPLGEAVQHAHQKGIIHRDLKPSNILVGLYDGKPVPKVIDFGVAKAIQHRLTDRTMFTEVGEIIGTLEYMPPEQIELGNLDIDTRADVYSLGVVLYELLTGTLPFSRNQLAGNPFTELLRMIKEVEPASPSTRLSTIQDLPAVASRCRLEPQKLVRSVAGELDWIVMKCLEKERLRRYQTANALTGDIQRYLSNEPVLAGPPSVGYRLGKFIKRHRTAVLASILCIALLIVATIVSMAMTFWALNEEKKAVQERDEKVKALQAESEERKRADVQTAVAQAVNQFFLKDVLSLASPERHPDRDLRLRTVLDLAAQKIEGGFAGQPLLESAVRLALGDAYRALWENDKARPHLERALSLRQEALGEQHPDTIQAMLYLARVYRNLHELSLSNRIYQRAYDISKAAHGDDHPDALAAQHGLGAILNSKSQDAAAEVIFRKVVEGRARVLGPDHPDTLKSATYLVSALSNQGKLKETREILPPLVDGYVRVHGEHHPETLQLMDTYALLLRDQKEYDKALELAVKADVGFQKSVGEFHTMSLIHTIDLASLYRLMGNGAEEAKLHARLLDTLHRHPKRGEAGYAIELADLGMRLINARAFDPAVAVLTECLEIRQRLQPKEWTTLNTKSMLGEALTAQKKYAQAEPLLVDAYQGLKSFAKSTRSNDRISLLRQRQAEALKRVIRLYASWGKPELEAQWKKELESLGK